MLIEVRAVDPCVATAAKTGALINISAVGAPADNRIIKLSMALKAKRRIPHYQQLIIY